MTRPLILLAACVLSTPLWSSEGLTLLEPGFSTTALPAGAGTAGMACASGGEFGSFLYVADSAAGVVQRIDDRDRVETFAAPFHFPSGSPSGPVRAPDSASTSTSPITAPPRSAG